MIKKIRLSGKLALSSKDLETGKTGIRKVFNYQRQRKGKMRKDDLALALAIAIAIAIAIAMAIARGETYLLERRYVCT